MKIRYVFFMFIIILFSIQNKADAQLRIVVDSVKIKCVVRIRPQNCFIEGFYDGPVLYTYCSFINLSTTDTVFLNSSNARIDILYNYQDSLFQNHFLCFSESDSDEGSMYFYSDTIVCLKPFETKKYFSQNYYLLGKHFFKEKTTNGKDTIMDCTKEVIETLPTLRVRYADGMYEAVSSGINKVIVGKIPVYYKPRKIIVE